MQRRANAYHQYLFRTRTVFSQSGFAEPESVEPTCLFPTLQSPA